MRSEQEHMLRGWIKSNRVVAAIAFLGLGGLLIFFAFWQPTRQPESSNSSPPETQSPPGQRTQSVSPNPRQQAPGPGSTKRSNTPESQAQEIISKLLHQRAGHVSAFEAAKFVEDMRSLGADALPTLATLRESEDPVERILGVYLTLEIGGMSDELEASILRDPSPHVKAEAAAWLYLHSEFDAWERLVSAEADSLTRDRARDLFVQLAPGANGLELPAAMALLHLGDGLPDLAAELLKRSPAALTEARSQLSEPSSSSAEPLFDALYRANPDNFDAILTGIIRETDGSAPVRWKAIWTLGETSMATETADFLEGAIAADPDDPLAHKMTEAAGKIETRSQSGVAPIDRLEAKLARDFLGGTEPDDRALSLVGYYVEWARRDRSHPVNPGILRRALEILDARPLKDQSLRRHLADIEYLLWRSAGA